MVTVCLEMEVWNSLMTLVASKRRRLFFTGDDDELFMIRSFNVTLKTDEQHLIVRSGKSEAEVTTIKDCARRIVLLTPGRTAPPAQLLWPTGFLCGWSVGLEFLAGQLA